MSKVMTPYQRLKIWAKRVAGAPLTHVFSYTPGGAINISSLREMAKVAQACDHYLVVTPVSDGGINLYTVRRPSELPIRIREA